jgi:hypothetical protein
MPSKKTMKASVKSALKPEREADRVQRLIDKAMSPEKMSVQEAYRFASILHANIESNLDGLKADLEAEGIDPYDLD